MQLHNCCCTCNNEEKSCVERVPIFSGLTAEEMLEIANTAIPREYKKGETIYSEGEPAEKLFVINKGRVKIFKLSEDGKLQIIRILEEGDFMGELSLFTHSILTNNAEAIEPSSVCIVDSSKINALIEMRPGIALKIMKELSLRLEKTESLIESIGLRDVEQRVADILLQMADAKGQISLSMSKKDLAAHIGMSQETLSRKLSGFQEQGWIKQEGQRKIVILNKEALVDIGSK